MRDLRTYLMFSLFALKSQMQHRVDFFMVVIGLIVVYVGQFINLRWLTARFPNLAGWDFDDLIMLYALSILAWGFVISFFFHMHNFEEQVRQGT